MQDNINAASTPSPLTCQQITDAIIDYLTGELAPEATTAFESHLQRCADCEAFFKTYDRTRQEMHSLTYETIPRELSNRVWNFLQKAVDHPPASDS